MSIASAFILEYGGEEGEGIRNSASHAGSKVGVESDNDKGGREIGVRAGKIYRIPRPQSLQSRTSDARSNTRRVSL